MILRALLISTIMSMFVTTASAQLRCTKDMFGTVRCNDGTSYSKDMFGTIRDNQGNSWRTDMFGTTRGSDGSSCRKDMFGTLICY